MLLEVLPTDKFFYDSPFSGDPACRCSRCDKVIGEQEPALRVWPTDARDHGWDPKHPGNTEFRYCPACVEACSRESGVSPARQCRQCGCSENDACFLEGHGNCWWVEADLCSHCQSFPGQATRYSILNPGKK